MKLFKFGWRRSEPVVPTKPAPKPRAKAKQRPRKAKKHLAKYNYTNVRFTGPSLTPEILAFCRKDAKRLGLSQAVWFARMVGDLMIRRQVTPAREPVARVTAQPAPRPRARKNRKRHSVPQDEAVGVFEALYENPTKRNLKRQASSVNVTQNSVTRWIRVGIALYYGIIRRTEDRFPMQGAYAFKDYLKLGVAQGQTVESIVARLGLAFTAKGATALQRIAAEARAMRYPPTAAPGVPVSGVQFDVWDRSAPLPGRR